MTTWGRRLTRNDDVIIPGTVICAEVSTVATPDQLNPRRQLHTLRCGHAISGRLEAGKWTRESETGFDSNSQLWEWVNCRRQCGKPVWIFSSDLSGLLTLTGFWGLMESGKFVLAKRPAQELSPAKRNGRHRPPKQPPKGLIVDADPPSALLCWNKSGWKLIALDLRNYLDKSVEQLATLLGMKICDAPCQESSKSEFDAYCAAKCRITQQCVSRLAIWHQKHEMGRFGFTIAGMALAGFRHRYMRHNIDCPPSQSDRDFERTAYFNGRTEPLWLGEVRDRRYYPLVDSLPPCGLYDIPPRGPFHLVDSRSFYGAVAQFQSVPIRCEAEGDGWPDCEGEHPPLSGDYLAEVRLNSPRHEFPVRLPQRTVFACGEFCTVLCGPELQRAVDAGCVTGVGHWRRYEIQTALRFWGQGIWDERVAAESSCDLLLSAVCKALLARLHGKFMQRENRWQVCPRVAAPGPWRHWNEISAATGEMRHYRSIGWETQIQMDAGDKPHCFPAIAAFVTSYGREWLRTWVKLAGRQNVLYLSTDALIVTDEGRDNLARVGIIAESGIGSCRVVETSDRVAIYAANHYELGKRICVAGLPVGTVIRGSGLATYTRRARMSATLASTPRESLPATQETANVDRFKDVNRLTAAGWLDQIVLRMESERWQKQMASDPT